MKIYNKGQRTFAIAPDLSIGPGDAAEVPPALEERVKGMLKTYSKELVDAGTAQADLQSQKAIIAEKDKKITDLEKLVGNLQRLLSKDTGDDRVTAVRRAVKAEQMIEELQAKLAAVKIPAPAAPSLLS